MVPTEGDGHATAATHSAISMTMTRYQCHCTHLCMSLCTLSWGLLRSHQRSLPCKCSQTLGWCLWSQKRRLWLYRAQHHQWSVNAIHIHTCAGAIVVGGSRRESNRPSVCAATGAASAAIDSREHVDASRASYGGAVHNCRTEHCQHSDDATRTYVDRTPGVHSPPHAVMVPVYPTLQVQPETRLVPWEWAGQALAAKAAQHHQYSGVVIRMLGCTYGCRSQCRRGNWWWL